jgi:hypothetical protein
MFETGGTRIHSLNHYSLDAIKTDTVIIIIIIITINDPHANCQDTPTQHKLNTVPHSHQSPEISSE